MRVKIEIEVSDGSTATIFDETVTEEHQVSQIAEILKLVYYLEKMLSKYVDETSKE